MDGDAPAATEWSGSARDVVVRLTCHSAFNLCETCVPCLSRSLKVLILSARPRIHALLSEDQMPAEGLQLAMVETDPSDDDDAAAAGSEEERTELVVVSARQLDPEAASDVWVIDHAWTYESIQGAEQVLKQVRAG